MKHKYFTTVLFLLVFVACKKTDTMERPVPQLVAEQKIPIEDFITIENVYVAGYNTDVNIRKQNAVYWKNGTPVLIGVPAVISMANAIAIANNDIYTGGMQINTGHEAALHKVWKNGVEQPMGSAPGCMITSIDVSNGIVYAVGYGNLAGAPQHFKYWANGIEDFFVPGGALANDITVSGSDIYIAGYRELSLGVPVATLWKNKVPLWLETSNASSSRANSIEVVNGNEHVVGSMRIGSSTGSRAVYWKNGVQNLLPVITATGDFGASANDVAVRGSNVFITGGFTPAGAKTKVMLWKNGSPIEITNGSVSSRGLSIAVSANNYLYIAGDERVNGVTVAKLWKYDFATGAITTVPLQGAGEGSSAYDIVIKPVKIVVDPLPGSSTIVAGE